MKQWKQGILSAMAVLLALSLSGCSFTIMGHTVTVGGTEESKPDNNIYGEAADAGVTLAEGVDATAVYGQTLAKDGVLYLVYNGTRNRDTKYFYPTEDGTLTVTVALKTDAEKYTYKTCKFAVWEKTQDGTMYEDGRTVRFYVDGNAYTYTFTDLDPTKAYKLSLSYDSNVVYLYGTAAVTGIKKWA